MTPDNKAPAWRTTMCRETGFQAREENGERLIEGYFAVFDGVYEMGDWGVERIDPHAFDETLRKEDIRALVNHDSTLVMGRNTAGTFEPRVDAHGLWGRIHINDRDQDAVNCWERVKRGDVTQCSFGFEILDELTEKLPDGRTQWTLMRVKLYEVSVCTFPAYEDTSIKARERDREDIKRRELDAWRAEMREKLKIKKEDN